MHRRDHFSRLSADTTTVADQICLNLNVRPPCMHESSASGTGFSTAFASDCAARLHCLHAEQPPTSVHVVLQVALRSLTQAAMVLVFMFDASWRLTIITFISVPCVILLCKVYGEYYRCDTSSTSVSSARTTTRAEGSSCVAGSCPRLCRQSWPMPTAWQRRRCRPWRL